MEYRQGLDASNSSSNVLAQLPGLFSACALGKVTVDEEEKNVYMNTKYMCM